MFLGRMVNSMSNELRTKSSMQTSTYSPTFITAQSQTSLHSANLIETPIETTPQMIFANYLLNEKNHFLAFYQKKQVDNGVFTDFHIQRRIGGGSFGTVLLALHGKKQVAMKILEKQHIVKLKQIRHVIEECQILGAVRCPFIVQLIFKFKDFANLYLCLEFVGGGEMFQHMRKQINKRFSENVACFYAAQLLLALEYLQYLDICHRDLKPENCLIGYDGFIKLTDFGFAKVVPGRTYTLCGTAQYLAPEILSNKGYGKGVDWWCFGVFLYELNAGFSPFNGSDHAALYSLILRCEYKFPKHFKEDLKVLIRLLLQTDPTKRLGCLANGAHDIKRQSYFQRINWFPLYEKKVPAEYRPQMNKDRIFEYFEEKKDFLIAKSTICLFEKEFEDF